MTNNATSFLLFESDLLQDRFVVIFKRAGLKPARLAHPDVVVFHIQEFDTIYAIYPDWSCRKRDRSKMHAAFKRLYELKKKFSGWLLPEDGGKVKFRWGTED